MEYAFTVDIDHDGIYFSVDLIAEYEASRAEPATHDCPGCDAEVSITNFKCSDVKPTNLALELCAKFNTVEDLSQMEDTILQQLESDYDQARSDWIADAKRDEGF